MVLGISVTIRFLAMASVYTLITSSLNGNTAYTIYSGAWLYNQKHPAFIVSLPRPLGTVLYSIVHMFIRLDIFGLSCSISHMTSRCTHKTSTLGLFFSEWFLKKYNFRVSLVVGMSVTHSVNQSGIL